MKRVPVNALVSFASKSLGGYQSFSSEVTEYHNQSIQWMVRNTKRINWQVIIPNFKFLFVLKKLIILPKRRSLIILSIPKNFKLFSSAILSSSTSSKGRDAMKSIQNLPFNMYLRAIFLPSVTNLPVLEFSYAVLKLMMMSIAKKTSMPLSKMSSKIFVSREYANS